MTDPQQPTPVPPPVAPGVYPAPPVTASAQSAPGQPGPGQPLLPGAPAPGYPASYPNPAYQAPAYPPLAPASGAQGPVSHAPDFRAPAAQAPIYQAPPGAFAGPAGGYAAPFLPAARPVLGPALGRVALILALIATVALTAVAAVLGWQIAQGASAAVDITTLESRLESGDLSFLTPVRDLVLWFEITAWTATGLGIWAIVQGIIAIAKRRGRAAGIAAVIIAAVGPFVFALVVYFAIVIGAATEIAGRAA